MWASRLSYGLSEDCAHFLWSGPVGVAQVNLVVLASELVALSLDERVHAGDGWTFGFIRPDVHNLD